MVRNSERRVKLGPTAGIVLCVFLLMLNGCSSGGNGGSGNFFHDFTIYWSVQVADLNGDGKPDIVASASFTSNDLSSTVSFVGVYLQDPTKPGTFLPPTKYNVGVDPVFLAIGDLNGDGKPDLVTVNSSRRGNSDPLANKVSVLLQDPAKPGQFLSPVEYAIGLVPSSVAIGDINGDGRSDLVVTNSGGIAILFQSNGAPGTFLAATPIALSATPSLVAIADLNGDQKPDLAITTPTNVSVLLQSSTVPGTFSSPTSYSAGLQPSGVAAADVNGDGKPDLAVANEGDPMTGNSPSVSVLLQNSAVPGTFLPATNFTADRASSHVAIADLNGDGKPDLAVVNIASVSVLLQDPNVPGHFNAATNYPCNLQAYSVAIADMNGDGKPDLVITNGDGIVIRLQDPATPGSFLAQTLLAN